MKKALSFFAAVVLLGTFTPQARAYDFSAVSGTGQTLYYNIVHSYGVSVSGGGNSTIIGNLDIPITVTYNETTYTVTSIENSAFSGCTGLTSVTIPVGVSSIESNAFSGCTGLTTMNYNAANCQSLGSNWLSGCTALNTVNIGNYVWNIPAGLFYGCTGLTTINYNAANCQNVSPTSHWLTRCTALTTVNIGNAVECIPTNAFRGCTGLTSVTIPSTVTSIGNYAFSGCSGLTSIIVENGNSVYDSRNNCNAIIETATNTLITGCKNTAIPTSVTSIGNNAFNGCTGLTSVTIPSTVTSIGNNAFSGCTGLTTINYNAANAQTPNRSDHWLSGCTALNTVNIGNSVETIPVYAFSGCTGLTSVTIPVGVTSIGSNAFSGCTGLTSINYNAANCNGDGFFSFRHWLSGCTALTTVNIGNSVNTISEYTFYECTGLTSIVVENGNSVYDSRNNCNAIIETASNTLITGCKNTAIPTSVTSIGDMAFNGCTGLTAITIPNSVTSIGDMAFYGCTGLTSITIPNSVTNIGYRVFADCTELTSIVVENGNSVYDSRSNCNAIIETATDSLITGCKNTVIPNSVTIIGDYAFANCAGLTRITIPNSVTSIGMLSFYGCTGLQVLVLGSGLSEVGGYAFYDCDNLDTIYSRNATPPTVADVNAFGNVSLSTPLVVPAGSLNAYATAYGWQNFTNIIEAAAEYYSVSLFANDTTMGSVSGGGQYASGTTATLTATAHDGYQFLLWSDGTTSNPYNLTVTGNVQLTAFFNAIEEPVHDTVTIHDTTVVTDTVVQTEYVTIHDTTYINVPVHDTTVVTDTVVQTEYVTIHDTTYITLTDTITYTIFDTVIIHDTVYITESAIEEVASRDIKVYSGNKQIIVEGATDWTVTLYDVTGRLLATRRDSSQKLHFYVPATGVYLIKIGEYPARRISVVR